MSLSKLQARFSAVVKEPLKPAVPIRKSVTDEYIVCLDDGRRFKTLRRHLVKLGMTADEYREKWGLSADYPMSAPDYSAKRSNVAKAAGFGRKAVDMKGKPAKRTKGSPRS
ncbi:MAG: MucR family transcriptional regulator [Candidatus Binatia bacterium]